MGTTRRGRPPLSWLDAAATVALPPGTVITVERTGKHVARLVGRIVAAAGGEVELATACGPVTLPAARISRARIVPSLYEPGDPVLRVEVSADDWRGGVVRTDGTDVLVEQIDGTFAWFAEADLEAPEARTTAAAAPRGPVAARAS